MFSEAFHRVPDQQAAISLGSWFAADPQPRFALSRDGHLLAANHAGQQVLDDGLVGIWATGRLSFGTSSSDAALQAALASVRASPATSSRLILRLRQGDWTAADLSLTTDPELFVLAFHRTVSSSRVAIDALADAFHLTSCEAAVLRDLCNGECPKSVARHLATSEHTVRAQMRSIYAKMGTRGLTNTVAMASVLMA